jgi:AGZA family xanthine/uracil permease-like MFS transporter
MSECALSFNTTSPSANCCHAMNAQGTLLGMVTAVGFDDKEGNFHKRKMVFAADGFATMFGSIFVIGMSSVTSNIKSGSRAEAGSCTGLTAIICGFYFFGSISFSPDHFQHSALDY